MIKKTLQSYTKCKNILIQITEDMTSNNLSLLILLRPPLSVFLLLHPNIAQRLRG